LYSARAKYTIPEHFTFVNHFVNTSKSEPWKAPVSEWLREMEEKRERKSAQRQARKARDHS